MNRGAMLNHDDVIHAITAPARLAMLRATGLLDSHLPSLSRITSLMRSRLGVPIALVSLVDEEREFFLADAGLPAPYATTREAPLSYSFCKFVVARNAALVCSDARRKPEFSSLRSVGELGIVAYLGVPITLATGVCLGALCVCDVVPRDWREEDTALLEAFALTVIAEAEHRLDDNVLRTVAHDLRVHHGAIRLASGLLAEGLAREVAAESPTLPSSVAGPRTAAQRARRAHLGAIDRAVDRATRLVDNLLDEAGPGKGGLRLHSSTFDFGALLDEVVATFGPLTRERGIALQVHGPRELHVSGDRPRLTRVLENLVNNAVYHEHAGGTITLETKRLGDGLEISVRDDGSGIDERDLPFVFDRAWQGRSGKARGAGLGLAICRGVVEAHGGTIRVERGRTQGAAVTFVLPGVLRPRPVASPSGTAAAP